MLLSTIISMFQDRFFQRYGDRVLPGHRKALKAMLGCRSEHGPHMLARCSDRSCDRHVYIPHSCGHRNCPHCQNHESQQWIEKQLDKRLPATSYLITFTLPRQIRDLAWKNQKTVYSLMFNCMRETLMAFTAHDPKLGGTPGFTAILHTTARSLDFHPHIHVIMPGASINAKTGLWRVKPPGYLFSHKALAKVFRAKMLQALINAGLRVPPDCPAHWVVDCKDVGDGTAATVYLGRYLYRGVIQEKDILDCAHGMVTFRYKHAKSGKYRTRTVKGEYFLYLLMLHVLPKGFRRTRCYGFLHHCSKKLIRFLQVVLKVNLGKRPGTARQRPAITCPVCGAAMKIVKTRVMKPLPRQCAQPT